MFNRSQCVKIDGKISEKLPVYCGVPQGSIVGPQMFIVYYNDFAECLQHSRAIKLAKDTVIYVDDSNF